MKLILEKKVTTEIDIDLPAFFTHAAAVYKLEENKTIEVRIYDGECSIRVNEPKVCYWELVVLNGTAITEEAFNVAFATAYKNISKEILQPNQAA